jgi:hypothetical protein
MTSFMTRVELHSAESSDYTNLHAEMTKRGFSQKIKSDDGIVYHLPTAEYEYIEDVKRQVVLDKAKAAVVAIKKSGGIIVTEAVGQTLNGLKKV